MHKDLILLLIMNVSKVFVVRTLYELEDFIAQYIYLTDRPRD